MSAEQIRPTMLPDDEAALVTTDGMNGWMLLLPDPDMGAIDPKSDVPVAVRLLTACMMRADDDDWVNEMLRWLDERMESDLRDAKPEGNA